MLNSCNKDEWKNQNKSISALWVASLSFRDEEKKNYVLSIVNITLRLHIKTTTEKYQREIPES